MRIEAIRLREVGPFDRGCALENLSRGLNVFVGPNELGKSTVFRALRLLFEEAHTANNKDVRRLKPDSGGAPCIECDFEVAGRRWRLHKQYLTGRVAELRDRDGRQVYRGGDVETALEEIVAGSFGAKSTLGLVWVAQGESLREPVPDAAARQTLEELVRVEAEAVSGGAQLAHVHDQIVTQLRGLVTEKARQPKAGGVYAQAIQTHGRISKDYEEARAKADASAERRARLDEVRGQIKALTEAQQQAGQRQEIAEARSAVERAQQARGQADLAAERRERLAAELASAQAALTEFDELTSELASTKDARAAADTRRSNIKGSLEQAEAERATAKSRHEAAILAQEQLQRDKVAVERQARRRALQEQCDGLQRRLGRARDVAGQGQSDGAAYDEIAIDGDVVGGLRRLAAEIDALEGLIEATAARIEVTYEAGRDGGVEVDGANIADGSGLVVDRPLTLVVPGVGEIRVLPGRSADGADPVARRADAHKALAEILARHGVESVVDAVAVWERKRDLGARLAATDAQLAALAPEGVDALAAAVADLAAQIEELDETTEVDGSDVERRWLRATQDVAEAAEAVSAANERVMRLHQEQAQVAADIASLEARQNALAMALSDGQEPVRAELVTRFETSGQALNKAVREFTAWSEKAPSVQHLAELAAAVAAAEERQRSATSQLGRLREEMRGLEGALSRDLEDGIDSEVAALQESLAVARRRVDQFDCDVAALQVLEREIADERGRRRDEIVVPLANRMGELAQNVLVDTRFDFDGRLAVTGLRRAGGEELIAQVSDGTREQVSVFARLGYAGLLAEAGRPVPLILDDALVYSDDERLARLFGVLEAAATAHQIIVLTCHGRSFAPLIGEHGGARIELGPWSPDER